jgi:hypothetical protein
VHNIAGCTRCPCREQFYAGLAAMEKETEGK